MTRTELTHQISKGKAEPRPSGFRRTGIGLDNALNPLRRIIGIDLGRTQDLGLQLVGDEIEDGDEEILLGRKKVVEAPLLDLE